MGRRDLEVSATTMSAEAADAATRRKSLGTSGEPERKTKLLPKRFSSGMMRRKVISISTLERVLSTTTQRPPSVLYAEHICGVATRGRTLLWFRGGGGFCPSRTCRNSRIQALKP